MRGHGEVPSPSSPAGTKLFPHAWQPEQGYLLHTPHLLRGWGSVTLITLASCPCGVSGSLACPRLCVPSTPASRCRCPVPSRCQPWRRLARPCMGSLAAQRE